MNVRAEDIKNIHIPRWEEFPAFELYIDQVIAFICEKLAVFNLNSDESLITPAMINNYVKNGVLHPPKKKKYDREHLAKLVVICICKRMLPLSYISESIEVMTRMFEVDEGYNTLCDEIEYEVKSLALPESYPAHSITDSPSRKVALLRILASVAARLLVFDRFVEQRRRLSSVAENMRK
ncbi:MAG: DUF1836 domain-containing protein [Clostridia bacterium]|nr:DUF1836 domain-containing protein [Clostridia bacterium]